jgi:hypothetical protein
MAVFMAEIRVVEVVSSKDEKNSSRDLGWCDDGISAASRCCDL